MSPSSKAPVQFDPYFGRKDICLHIERTVKTLFPSPMTPMEESTAYDLPPFRDWLSYLLYRTALPNTSIFHGLHLLRRLAAIPASQRLSSPLFSLHQPLGHYSLVTAAFVLATDYSMDDSYSNRSWCVAAKDLYVLPEMNEIQLDMFRALGWQLRADGEELGSLVAEDEMEWAEMVEEEKRFVEEKLQMKRAKSLGRKLGTCLPLESTTPSSTRSNTGAGSPDRHQRRSSTRHNPLERTSSRTSSTTTDFTIPKALSLRA